jgi:hypothetical protein
VYRDYPVAESRGVRATYGPVVASWPADVAALGLDVYNDAVDGPTVRLTAATGWPAATPPARPRLYDSAAPKADSAIVGTTLHVPLFR